MRDLTIGIVGAGIGGLAAASLLADAGHRITIFDQFDAPRPVGSGLVIQPVGQAVLARIGADVTALRLGTPITRMTGREVLSGRRVLDVRYDPVRQQRFGLAIHRASLFHALFEQAAARGVAVVSASCVTSVPVVRLGRMIRTTDGCDHGPFNLIIDASGSRSVLSPIAGRPLPYGAVWGTVPWPVVSPLPTDNLTQRYRRADKMLGVLPLGQLSGDPTPRAAIFWSLPQSAMAAWQAAPLDAWKAEATSLWPEIAPFLTAIQNHDDMVPARYEHGTLARPYLGALAFIGDAAHRASPQLGQGANMALLDALALSTALQNTTSLDEALPAYAAMRRWHVRFYQGISWAFTPQYQSDSRVLPWMRDRVLMPISRIAPVTAALTRLVCGDLVPPLADQHLT